jgi:hypothetical protein
MKVIEEPQLASEVERRLPWFVDIFLYPLSVSGLVNLVVFLCAPIFIGLIHRFILNHIWPVGELIVLILYLLFVGYVLYYLSWCVVDSTKGKLRAPDITFQPSPAREELLGQVGILLACIAVCFWPAAVYYILTGKTDLLFWLLAAIGLLFFPMALLAGFLYDSIGGLNPILIIKSVIKTFPAYLPVVIFFAGLFAVFSRVTPQLPQSESLESMLLYLSQIINIICNARFALRLTGFIYLAMVGAHILGRFYWRCKDKLDWGL